MCLFELDCRASHTWGPSVPYGVGYPQMPWEPSVASRARVEAPVPQRAGWCWALTAASMMGMPGTCCLSEMLWAEPRWALPPGHQVQCPATERAAALMPKGLWALGGKAGGTGCQGAWYRIGRGKGCKGARLGDPGGWGQLLVAGPGLYLRLKLILLSSTALQPREWDPLPCPYGPVASPSHSVRGPRRHQPHQGARQKCQSLGPPQPFCILTGVYTVVLSAASKGPLWISCGHEMPTAREMPIGSHFLLDQLHICRSLESCAKGSGLLSA